MMKLEIHFDGVCIPANNHINDIISQRVDRELAVIIGQGYADCFVFLCELVNWAKQESIPVGPGRGAASGSIVNYVLGITGIDPIRFKLHFERFINPDRAGPPSICLDFAEERRKEILDHISLGRISDEGALSTEHAKDQLEANEPVCIDILGLRVLSDNQRVIDHIASSGHKITLDLIPEHDAKTFNLFCSGKTEGVFMFESDGMKDILKTFKPSKFEDLVLLNAMYRPDCLESIPSIIAQNLVVRASIKPMHRLRQFSMNRMGYSSTRSSLWTFWTLFMESIWPEPIPCAGYSGKRMQTN